MTCSMARDWTDGLSKVVRRSAVEAAVGQHTQPEPDSLWNFEPVRGRGSWEGAASPLPTSYGIWGSAVSSLSRVRGGAPAAKHFLAIYGHYIQ